ncbi:MAG: Plug domain-containing protein [Saprospiraceae bacterium]|nr:Plug domain-containing protein [Saprospiraceae bacterium]
MKKILLKIYGLLILASVYSCSTTSPVVDTDRPGQFDDDYVIEMQNPQTLLEIFQRLPGVVVSNNGGYAAVTVRGGVPLFVVDNVRVGRGYNAVVGVVNAAEISSVELLTNPSETVLYGREGGNGVIIIRTN